MLQYLKNTVQHCGIQSVLIMTLSSHRKNSRTLQEIGIFSVMQDHHTIPMHGESAVKAAKALINKSNESNSDPFMGLLEIRNTPNTRQRQQSLSADFKQENKNTVANFAEIVSSKVGGGAF